MRKLSCLRQNNYKKPIAMKTLAIAIIGLLFPLAATAAQAPDQDATWSKLTKQDESEQAEYDFNETPEPGTEWLTPQKTEFLLGIAITYGGDELANVKVVKNKDTITEHMNSGELFYIYGGALVQIPGMAFRTQITIGYHIDQVDADNGSISFTRVPIDVIPMWEFEKHRIGMGLTYHMFNRLDGKDAGYPVIDYADAFGTLFTYHYKLTQDISVGFRYTEVKYKPVGSNNSEDNSDGTNYGLHLQWVF